MYDIHVYSQPCRNRFVLITWRQGLTKFDVCVLQRTVQQRQYAWDVDKHEYAMGKQRVEVVGRSHHEAERDVRNQKGLPRPF